MRGGRGGARWGDAGRGEVWQARWGQARQGKAGRGRARRGKVGQGRVGRGVVGRGMVRQGKARQCKAWLGKTRRGEAGRGEMRRGEARRGWWGYALRGGRGEVRWGEAEQGGARRVVAGEVGWGKGKRGGARRWRWRWRCRAGGRGLSEMGTGCERLSVRAHSRGSRAGEDPFGRLHGNGGAPKRICGREAPYRVTAGWGRGGLQPFAFSHRGRARSPTATISYRAVAPPRALSVRICATCGAHSLRR